MSIARACDLCKFAKQRLGPDREPVSDVKRYTLRCETDQTRESGQRLRRYQMSAGGIDLCGECWGRICQPRMNPKKASNKGATWRAA